MNTPGMERTVMKQLTLFGSVCVIALGLGMVSKPLAGAPTDSLWREAVAISGMNEDLVPGLMKIHMQEVDKHGKPKAEDRYHEVWSTLSLGEDGEVEYEVVKVIEDGEDVTEKEKAKEEGGDEDSESQTMEGYNPFDPDSQARVSIESLGNAGIVNGRNTIAYTFRERTEDDVEISGRAWLEGGDPVMVTTPGRWVLVYEAGEHGIADGGVLFLQVSPFWGWSTPQSVSADAPGYTTVSTDATGVMLNPVTVADGMLAIEVSGRRLRRIARPS